jgi:hypothetical protein
MNYIYDIKFKFNDKFDFTLVKKKIQFDFANVWVYINILTDPF